MTRAMKIVYACLIFGGLAGCGDSGEKSQDKPPALEKIKSQGEGELSVLSSEDPEKQTVLMLKSGEEAGSVYCERRADNKATISLGMFFITSSGLKEDIPLTGLTFTLDQVQEAGDKELKDVIFNLEDGNPSSPQCTLNSEGIANAKLKASIRCADNIERDEWGFALIDAHFTCGM